MDALKQTAIVILNYNGSDFLQRFLPGVIRFSSGATIVVADNCSSDDSVKMLHEKFPEVQLIQIPENRGFCGGYNYALKKVESPFLVLLNSDVEVTDGWLEPMVRLLANDSSVAAVQPKVLSWHQRHLFEYAGAAGGYIDALGYPFCRGRIFDTVETDEGQFNDVRPVFWATGACLSIRSSVFHAMGGFDEDFFAHMEEIDLCWKIHRAGQKVMYTSESTVYHIGGGTLSKLNPRKTYLNFRNGLFLIVKNMRGGELLWKLPVRMTLDWVALAAFLAKGSFGNAWSVAKAHAHFIVGFTRVVKKRNTYRHLTEDVRKTGTVYPGSIVAAYYARGRKLYRDLFFFRNPRLYCSCGGGVCAC